MDRKGGGWHEKYIVSMSGAAARTGILKEKGNGGYQ